MGEMGITRGWAIRAKILNNFFGHGQSDDEVKTGRKTLAVRQFVVFLSLLICSRERLVEF
jgi:hypothetical protein